MERNWYLLCIIALASATLLLLTVVNMAAVTGNCYAGLSDANKHRIGLGIDGVAFLVAIFGPMILAKKYAVGLRWGGIGLLLFFATYAAFILPALFALWPMYLTLFAPIGYLILFGVLYLRRRRLAATQQSSVELNRFD